MKETNDGEIHDYKVTLTFNAFSGHVIINFNVSSTSKQWIIDQYKYQELRYKNINYNVPTKITVRKTK